jgi:SAM-dependent methyltransferase
MGQSLESNTLSLKSGQGRQAWAFLTRYLPYSLAARELMRLQALSRYGTLAKPILDIGCGDGLFWECVIRSFDHKGSSTLSGLLGIDISADELNLASVRLREHGGQVVNRDICADRPLGDGQRFQSVIANCSLEHVTSIEAALRNVHSMMKNDGVFLLFVPVPRWTDSLRTKRLAGKISHRLGGLVGGGLDGFFQHNHLYPAEVWKFLLGGIGFEVTQIVGVGSAAANSMFERFLPTAFLSFLFKILFGRYPRRRLKFWPGGHVDRFIADVESGRVLNRDLESPDIVEYFIVCRKIPITS